jgi:hypothetical protein
MIGRFTQPTKRIRRRLVKPPDVKFNTKFIQIADRKVAVCPTWPARKESDPMEKKPVIPVRVG